MICKAQRDSKLTRRIICLICFIAILSQSMLIAQTGEAPKSPPKTVKGMMQARPGGPLEEVEVAVHEVPVNLSSVRASQAELADHDLVLGVVLDGQAMAYPIRYLAMYEVVDDEVAHSPIAATW